jgi:endonuclease III
MKPLGIKRGTFWQVDNVLVLFQFRSMQQQPFPFGQAADLCSVRDRLRAVYGEIREPERLNPIDQFVRSFLGSRTYDEVSWNTFYRLTSHYRSWDRVAEAQPDEIEALLADVTHPGKKAVDLIRALQKIRARAGAIDLDFLKNLETETALLWLEQIHGVGRKIAAATLNFSTLRKPAFVADVHVLRVLQRFGFVKTGADARDAYDVVMAPAEGWSADELYQLHWHLKILGQRTCTYQRALCNVCPLSAICLQRIGEAAETQFAGHFA